MSGTNRARCCFTSVIERELVCSASYGRCWRNTADLFTALYANTDIGWVVGVRWVGVGVGGRG